MKLHYCCKSVQKNIKNACKENCIYIYTHILLQCLFISMLRLIVIVSYPVILMQKSTDSLCAPAPNLMLLHSVAHLCFASPSVQLEVGQISWQWRTFLLLPQMWHTFSCVACITFYFGTAPTSSSHVELQRERDTQLHFDSFSCTFTTSPFGYVAYLPSLSCTCSGLGGKNTAVSPLLKTKKFMTNWPLNWLFMYNDKSESKVQMAKD